MILFFTLAKTDNILGIHQDLTAAREFANRWNSDSLQISSKRDAKRIVTAHQSDNTIKGRTTQFNSDAIIEQFELTA